MVQGKERRRSFSNYRTGNAIVVMRSRDLVSARPSEGVEQDFPKKIRYMYDSMALQPAYLLKLWLLLICRCRLRSCFRACLQQSKFSFVLQDGQFRRMLAAKKASGAALCRIIKDFVAAADQSYVP